MTKIGKELESALQNALDIKNGEDVPHRKHSFYVKSSEERDIEEYERIKSAMDQTNETYQENDHRDIWVKEEYEGCLPIKDWRNIKVGDRIINYRNGEVRVLEITPYEYRINGDLIVRDEENASIHYEYDAYYPSDGSEGAERDGDAFFWEGYHFFYPEDVD